MGPTDLEKSLSETNPCAQVFSKQISVFFRVLSCGNTCIFHTFSTFSVDASSRGRTKLRVQGEMMQLALEKENTCFDCRHRDAVLLLKTGRDKQVPGHRNTRRTSLLAQNCFASSFSVYWTDETVRR